ncbi:Hypothetical predicted protein, partial [Marmota monax]
LSGAPSRTIDISNRAKLLATDPSRNPRRSSNAGHLAATHVQDLQLKSCVDPHQPTWDSPPSWDSAAMEIVPYTW